VSEPAPTGTGERGTIEAPLLADTIVRGKKALKVNDGHPQLASRPLLPGSPPRSTEPSRWATWPKLEVKNVRNRGAYTRKSLLKFDLSGVKGKVVSARLHLAVISHTGELGTDKLPLAVVRLADNWTETGVTWFSMPDPKEKFPVGHGELQDGMFVLDITPVVAKETDATLSILIDSLAPPGPHVDGPLAKFASRDNKEGLAPPRLVIEVGR